jgi:biopolymer transport protein ExbD
VLLLSFASFAQKENNIWAVGYRAGIDFNSGSASTIKTSITSMNCSASICDASGQLMFYTSGDTVWDKNGHAMPNGYDLIGGTRTAIRGAALIVPFINDPHKYYVFSHENIDGVLGGDLFAGRLYYCVVDMNLNGGLGDVVTGKKTIPVDSSLGNKLVVVPGNDCNLWLVTHKYDTSFTLTDTNTNKFLVYNITDTGFNPTPVISNVGNLTGVVAYISGDIVASSDRKKLALNSGASIPTGLGSEIYDFSPATGLVSNPILLDTGISDIGVSFSPDNSKLYISSYTNGDQPNILVQYDLSGGTASSIISSRTLIDTLSTMPSFATVLRLGPDGKIYGIGGNGEFINPIGGAGADSIFYIAQPNNSGTSCALHKNALGFQVGTGTSYGLGLPYVKPLQDTFHTHTAVTLTDSVTLSVPSGYFSYKWNNTNTDTSITVKDTGTYYVRYSNYCQLHTDTFFVSRLSAVSSVNKNTVSLSYYPNPTSDDIIVKIDGLSNVNGVIKITDMLGKVVITKHLNTAQQTINVSGLANGIYNIVYIGKSNVLQLQGRFSIAR